MRQVERPQCVNSRAFLRDPGAQSVWLRILPALCLQFRPRALCLAYFSHIIVGAPSTTLPSITTIHLDLIDAPCQPQPSFDTHLICVIRHRYALESSRTYLHAHKPHIGPSTNSQRRPTGLICLQQGLSPSGFAGWTLLLLPSRQSYIVVDWPPAFSHHGSLQAEARAVHASSKDRG